MTYRLCALAALLIPLAFVACGGDDDDDSGSGGSSGTGSGGKSGSGGSSGSGSGGTSGSGATGSGGTSATGGNGGGDAGAGAGDPDCPDNMPDDGDSCEGLDNTVCPFGDMACFCGGQNEEWNCFDSGGFGGAGNGEAGAGAMPECPSEPPEEGTECDGFIFGCQGEGGQTCSCFQGEWSCFGGGGGAGPGFP